MVRSPDSNFNLANFMRVHLFTALGAMKIGMDILFKEENAKLDKILGYGGFFTTESVGQSVMAAALAPVSVMETAGEGGAWGITLLASYMTNKTDDETLKEYLSKTVFADNDGTIVLPNYQDVEEFD